jgi:hypothetical protein
LRGRVSVDVVMLVLLALLVVATAALVRVCARLEG